MLTIILFSAPLHNHSVSGPMPTVILLAPRQQLLFLPHVNNHFVFGPAPTNYYSCPMPTTILFSAPRHNRSVSGPTSTLILPAPRQKLLFLPHVNNHFVVGPTPAYLHFSFLGPVWSTTLFDPTPITYPFSNPCHQQSYSAPLQSHILFRPRVINNFIRPHAKSHFPFSIPCHQQPYSALHKSHFPFTHTHTHPLTCTHTHMNAYARTYSPSITLTRSHTCMYALTRTPPLGLTNDSHVHDSSRIHTQTGP